MKNLLKAINMKMIISIITCVCLFFMSCEVQTYASECAGGGQHADSDKDCACDKCGAAMHVYETKTYVPTSTAGGVVSGDLSNTEFSATNMSNASLATITLSQWGNFTKDNTTYSHNIAVPKEGDYVILVTPKTTTGTYAQTTVELDDSINIAGKQIVHLTQGNHWIETSINVTQFRKSGKVTVDIDIAAITETKCANCGVIKE